VVLGNDVSSRPAPQQPYESKDLLAIIPLRHVPYFRHDGKDARAKEIGLLDPLDMMPLVFEVGSDGNEHTEAEVCLGFMTSISLIYVVLA
jgi:hypothetical protein